jgi:triosephosphate isomerase (TIM)
MKLLFANWKTHPADTGAALTLAKASDAENVVICPPTLFIPAVVKTAKKAQVGAQDGFYEGEGPFTGYVAMSQLKASGARYVIIGHSERRALGEDDTMIAKKVAAACAAGLTPVVCVGETREEHNAGRSKEIVDRQLRAAFSLLPAEAQAVSPDVYIAYEPVWAISTNQPAGMQPVADSPEAAQTVARYLEGIVRGLPVVPHFLYGGSVNEGNVAGFLACPEFAGALVGGASIRSAEFKKMIRLVSEV